MAGSNASSVLFQTDREQGDYGSTDVGEEESLNNTEASNPTTLAIADDDDLLCCTGSARVLLIAPL